MICELLTSSCHLLSSHNFMVTNPFANYDNNNSSAVRKLPLQTISWCCRFIAVLRQSTSKSASISLQSDNLGFGMGVHLSKTSNTFRSVAGRSNYIAQETLEDARPGGLCRFSGLSDHPSIP
jgi:hypothetical protein